MRFMNDWDIDRAVNRYVHDSLDYPNLGEASLRIQRLAEWTNRNSDGWAYWPKPTRAAAKLMDLVEEVDYFNPEDVTADQVKRASVPIKAFLTRQGVDHAVVFGGQS